MPVPKTVFVALISLLLPLMTAQTIFAFHEGGDDYCWGCHGATSTGNTFSLRGQDASSTCLRCHEQTHRVLTENGSGYSPGGDFYWLTREYRREGVTDSRDSHGHNVVAADYGLIPDAVKTSAPNNGGSYFNSSWLGCTSCHDPHQYSGADTQYRLLRSTGWSEDAAGVSFYFVNPAPTAVSYQAQNGDWPTETDDNHSDYGQGMSEWCSNCHVGFDGGTHGHPAGRNAFLNRFSDFYNSYVATGDFTGSAASSYDHLVPFERGASSPELDPHSTRGPDFSSNTMCLTCHRAHASPFANIGRWDFRTELLSQSPVFLSSDSRHAFYGESVEGRYGPFQRSLCNKCHVRD